MNNIINFGLNLAKLYIGANSPQIKIRLEDDNMPYLGRKIPLSVTVSCTHFCNLKCVHCQSENSKADKDVPTQRFLELIDEIADAGCKKIGFTGGEPLFRSDIGEIIKRCLMRGLSVSLVSNGTLVPRRIHELEGINLLFLSFDGNRAVHDMVRGKGNFDEVITAAEVAREHNIPVAFLSTLGSFNYGYIEEMIKIVRDNKVHWMVGLIQTEFTGNKEQDIDVTKLKEKIDNIKRAKGLRTSKGYLELVCKNVPPERCFAGIGYCIIDPKGIVYPCFPAQFDRAYKGVSIMDMPFGKAFEKILLYRRLCQRCSLACHMEMNYLYQFHVNSIWNSFLLTMVFD